MPEVFSTVEVVVEVRSWFRYSRLSGFSLAAIYVIVKFANQVAQCLGGSVFHRYETLVENLVDPAHAPFAHHNIQASIIISITSLASSLTSLVGWN